MEGKTVPYSGSEYQNRRGTMPSIWRWIYSPSGKYAVDFFYVDIGQSEGLHYDLHYNFYVFSVLDVVKGSWKQYRTICGPMRTSQALYWLQDDCLVSVDHSKSESTVTQNILYLDHEKGTVDCTLARTYAWRMHIMWPNESGQPLRVNNQDFFLACGSQEAGMFDVMHCRLFPWNPLQMKELRHYEYSSDTKTLARSFHPDYHVSGFPTVFGSKYYMSTSIQSRNVRSQFHVSQYLCIDMQSIVNEGREVISPESPGVTLVNFPVPSAPHYQHISRWSPHMLQCGSKVVFVPKETTIRQEADPPTRSYHVYVVDLEAGTTSETTVVLAEHDFVAMDRFGTLSVWFPHREEPLRTRTLHLPKYSPSSLFDTCRQKILNSCSGDELELPERSVIFQGN